MITEIEMTNTNQRFITYLNNKPYEFSICYNEIDACLYLNIIGVIYGLKLVKDIGLLMSKGLGSEIAGDLVYTGNSLIFISWEE